MRGQKCAVCGYHMDAGEALLSNALHILGGVIGSQTEKAIGTNTLSNATKMKCPKCGSYGRWIRDDE
ncbi:hypothetical protein Cp4436_01447 [Clostridium perfringens]|uniref:hypothetical protein n=1 Tax=Clostridium perfringens TaxID=1502 RepID=UPI002441E133|nr:hypothetical protein [Clostridium perfringens]MDG6889414.1 hypothetical protein [Clostridium perfringens]